MRMILVLLAIVCWDAGFAQSKQETEFENAIVLFNEEKYDEAAEAFSRFMRDYPNHELKPRAHYNLAFTYRNMKNPGKAREIFAAILDQKYNERDENSLMEPYTLYKHHSSRQLAIIAIEERNFDDAEKYIQYFHKKYPYQHFCGNEWASYAIFKAVMEAKVYEGKNKPQLAVKELAPHLFYNGLARNQFALEELGGILERNFDSATVKEMFTSAFTSLRFEKKKGSQTAMITFAGIDVAVSPYAFEQIETEHDLEAIRAQLRSHILFLKYL